MATARRKRKEESTTLVLSGAVTVATAGRTKAALQKALDTATTVTVSLENITSVDVSLLQLLCSAHRTAAGTGKTLTIVGIDREPVASLLLQAGFLRHIGCDESTHRSCLWIERQPGKGSTAR